MTLPLGAQSSFYDEMNKVCCCSQDKLMLDNLSFWLVGVVQLTVTILGK